MRERKRNDDVVCVIWAQRGEIHTMSIEKKTKFEVGVERE